MLFLFLISLLFSSTNARVMIPSSTTWANLAWGYKNGGGGNDVGGEKVVLIDIDNVGDNVTRVVEELKKDDHLVMCYVSVGTLEGFRDYNKDDWKGLTMGTMKSFDDEKWLDIRQLDRLLPLMESRFDKMASVGCDIIEPDNMDCYSNSGKWVVRGTWYRWRHS